MIASMKDRRCLLVLLNEHFQGLVQVKHASPLPVLLWTMDFGLSFFQLLVLWVGCVRAPNGDAATFHRHWQKS